MHINDKYQCHIAASCTYVPRTNYHLPAAQQVIQKSLTLYKECLRIFWKTNSGEQTNSKKWQDKMSKRIGNLSGWRDIKIQVLTNKANQDDVHNFWSRTEFQYKCTQPSIPGSTQAHTHFLSCFIPGTGLHHRYGLRVAAHINEKLLSLGVPVTKTNKNSAFQKSKMQWTNWDRGMI